MNIFHFCTPSTMPNIKDFDYKLTHPFATRLKESQKLRYKYPNRCPVIVEVDDSSKFKISLDKNKYLVPNDLLVGQMLHILRKRIHLNSSQSIFLFVNNTIPLTSQTMSSLHISQSERCGFLYLKISVETTFGSPLPKYSFY